VFVLALNRSAGSVKSQAAERLAGSRRERSSSTNRNIFVVVIYLFSPKHIPKHTSLFVSEENTIALTGNSLQIVTLRALRLWDPSPHHTEGTDRRFGCL
jgi:hypothetical protein